MTTIHEDDPRWDCETMGNRVCGDPEPNYPAPPAPTSTTTTTQPSGQPTVSVPPKEHSELPVTGGDVIQLTAIGLLAALVGACLTAWKRKGRTS